jgi:hypothetical protein
LLERCSSIGDFKSAIYLLGCAIWNVRTGVLLAQAGKSCLVGGLVVAGGAAGFAVHQAVVADARVDDGLAQATEFFALARSFGLFALGAFEAGGAGSGTHMPNVARCQSSMKMTLVIVWRQLLIVDSRLLIEKPYMCVDVGFVQSTVKNQTISNG